VNSHNKTERLLDRPRAYHWNVRAEFFSEREVPQPPLRKGSGLALLAVRRTNCGIAFLIMALAAAAAMFHRSKPPSPQTGKRCGKLPKSFADCRCGMGSIYLAERRLTG